LRTTAYVVAACLAFAVPAAARETRHASLPTATSPATVATLHCARGCGSAGAVRPGSLLRVRGRELRRADEVVFLGVEGAADDVSAAPSVRRRTSVDVRVPLGAAGGPVAVVDRNRAASAPSPAALAVESVPATAGPSVEIGVSAPRVYFDSARPAVLTYVLHAASAAPVTVDLVREVDGAVIAQWIAPQVAPETAQRVVWDGRVGGYAQPDGRYSFRVTGGGAPAVAAFDFVRHRFPILGPYSLGGSGAAFGGGRGHQGHDVFARCGTPLVAAHGGVVEYVGYHGRAGNYLVIDNEDADSDYAYMHLRDAPLVAKGERVLTGQPIGFVGSTGSATACHLHFEAWSAPGWYQGGQPVDPLSALRAWAAR
jgi:murein DD-endopeptidase MepM/ murein hydrolase activator NlpD